MNPIRNDYIYGDLRKHVHFDEIPEDSFFRTKSGGGLTMWKKEDGRVEDEDGDECMRIVESQNFECVPLLVIEGRGEEVVFDIPDEFKHELNDYTVYVEDVDMEYIAFDELNDGDYFLAIESVFQKIDSNTVLDVCNGSVRNTSNHSMMFILFNEGVVYLQKTDDKPLRFEANNEDF